MLYRLHSLDVCFTCLVCVWGRGEGVGCVCVCVCFVCVCCVCVCVLCVCVCVACMRACVRACLRVFAKIQSKRTVDDNKHLFFSFPFLIDRLID